MRKKKIAQVITRMDRGGAPDIVRLICERFDRNVFDVTLIYGPTERPTKETLRFLNSFSPNVIFSPYLKRPINILSDIPAFFQLYRVFSREKFDVVHTHTAKAGFLGRIAARLAGVPLIVHSPHGHNFYGYFGPLMSRMVVLLERVAALFCDKITVLTKMEKAEMVSFKICGPKKISVIYSGLELSRFSGPDKGKVGETEGLPALVGKRLVGMVGRLESVKGPEYFIEAAGFIAEKIPDVNFLVTGDGVLKKSLEERCRELNLRGRFIFTGWRDDVSKIMSKLDVLVLPSLNEAVGRVLIEAGARGIPVVASNVGGVPEIVRNNETGILTPPKDARALSDAIVSLLGDDKKWQRMADAAKSWIDDKFSADKMAADIYGLYNGYKEGEKL